MTSALELADWCAPALCCELPFRPCPCRAQRPSPCSCRTAAGPPAPCRPPGAGRKANCSPKSAGERRKGRGTRLELGSWQHKTKKKKAPGAQAAPRGSREGISPSHSRISEVFSPCPPLPSALGGCFSHISFQNESGHPRAELGAHRHLHHGVPLPGSLSPPCPKAEGTEAELGLAAGRGWLQQRLEEGRGDWQHLHGASGEIFFPEKQQGCALPQSDILSKRPL